MDRQGVYLYCFARSVASRDLGAAPVDGGKGVTSLQVGQVMAAFSEVELNEFEGESAETHLGDPAWIIPRVRHHERVVAGVMRSSPVLPVRFGAVFSSKRALAELLEDKYEEISHFLDYVSDKEEWAVKGFVDTEKGAQWLLASDPALLEQRSRMPESRGARYFHEKQLRTAAQRRLKRWCGSVARQISEELKSCAVDSRVLDLQPKALSERDAEMVFNCGFLLRRGQVADFLGRVEQVKAEYAAQGVMLDATGPWPPYSFCPSIGVVAGR